MASIPTLTTAKALEALCARMARGQYITVDTEFLRERTYRPQLCLLQMANDEEAALVDPLAQNMDLAPFFELMANPKVTKVFHSARQDVEIILQLGALIPRPLFDTQIAAMVCGYGEAVSYDHLVSKLCGHMLDKSQRFTDWRLRPLSDRQKAYALADVTHLRGIYKALRGELEARGRITWVKEEMNVLCNPCTYTVKPEEAWKRLKLRAKRPLELAVAQAIAAWREREAQSRNAPRGHILKDDAIHELAAQRPDTAEALEKMRALPKGFSRSKFAKELLEVIAKTKALPKEELPKLPKKRQKPEGFTTVVELLKVLLKIISQENDVAAKIIATTNDLEEIAASNEADVPALKGWRKALFGDLALRVKAGEVGFALSEQNKIVLIPRQA